MVASADRPYVVETPTRTVVYRATDMAPEEAFSAGLPARRPDRRDTLEYHQGTSGRTQYASASYSADQAWRRRRYRYKIMSYSPGIDLNVTLGRMGLQRGFSFEQEVDFTGLIRPEEIVEVYDYQTGETIANPNFAPVVVHARLDVNLDGVAVGTTIALPGLFGRANEPPGDGPGVHLVVLPAGPVPEAGLVELPDTSTYRVLETAIEASGSLRVLLREEPAPVTSSWEAVGSVTPGSSGRADLGFVVPIEHGVVVLGPLGGLDRVRGEALQTFPGWFTVPAHLDSRGGLMWGDRSLEAEGFVAVLGELPGWRAAVELNGGQVPGLWLVVCNAARSGVGQVLFADAVWELIRQRYGQARVLASAGVVEQSDDAPGVAVVRGADGGGWRYRGPDGAARSYGSDPRGVMRELAGDGVPLLMVTPPVENVDRYVDALKRADDS